MKPIWNQLTAQDGRIIINQNGNEYEGTLPARFIFSEDQLTNTDALVAKLKADNTLKAVLDAGLKQTLIEFRALWRITDKSGKPIDLTDEQLATIAKKAEDFRPSLLRKPEPESAQAKKATAKAVSSKLIELVNNLKAAGVPEANITKSINLLDITDAQKQELISVINTPNSAK